ncbi:DUF3467 domain-containing protein [Geofilum rhodophaeum]|jgi:hypothetical protein|uniref:DUF3467 domain-containing protein n=1 Tax=Geofilum rhodophaeum TaxID=1965019 RepID=UPI000B5294DA|nr:DUF3467 domain-containing protein [Geofilum rhodophaeum]HHU56847.1 DUF3467 domain-containing protein [Bacteroidales bacterium]
MEDPKKAQQLKIELNEEIGQGIYSNLAIISHSPSEFVLDFVRVMPGVPKAQVKSRIVLTPEHAKRLLHALQDNISRYEKHFGPVKDIKDGSAGFNPLPFSAPGGQA